LGEVQDCPDPKQRHWELIRQNPKMLFTIADDIINHLYHEAGLFMSYKTRNTLLTLYTYCYMYQTNEVKFDEVVVQFWKARRKLRMDLQIEDTGEFSELSQIMKRLQLSNK